MVFLNLGKQFRVSHPALRSFLPVSVFPGIQMGLCQCSGLELRLPAHKLDSSSIPAAHGEALKQ